MLDGVEIGQVAWSDSEGVRRFTEVSNAVRRRDSPWMHPMTVRECVGELRFGWDGEPPVAFVARDARDDVAEGEYQTSTYDNLHLAWLQVEVHPDHRRRGYGSSLFEALVGRARAEGRTSVGIDGWADDAAKGFAAHHGLDQKAVEVQRRQYPRELDWASLDALYDEALPHAAAYDLVPSPVPTPEAELEAMSVMVAAINDAPNDDLDIEDESLPPQRIVAYETSQAARGVMLHRVVARHRPTGQLAGQTVVAVDGERPHLAEQDDTSVVRAHRGHRLGLLLKLEMLRWLRQEQSQLESIDTWNAESNRHMIAVNEALDYRVLGRSLDFQRSI
jgi:GNAT superfamily N-acetyltransferase